MHTGWVCCGFAHGKSVVEYGGRNVEEFRTNLVPTLWKCSIWKLTCWVDFKVCSISISFSESSLFNARGKKKTANPIVEDHLQIRSKICKSQKKFKIKKLTKTAVLTLAEHRFYSEIRQNKKSTLKFTWFAAETCHIEQAVLSAGSV